MYFIFSFNFSEIPILPSVILQQIGMETEREIPSLSTGRDDGVSGLTPPSQESLGNLLGTDSGLWVR